MPPTPKRHLATFGNKKDFEGFKKGNIGNILETKKDLE